jgi:hypothetical protein
MTPSWVARVTSWVLASLFFYVAVVPHRYLALGPSDIWAGRAITWAPTLLLCGLAALVVFWYRDKHTPILVPACVWIALGLMGSMASAVPTIGVTRTFYYSLTGVVVSLLLLASRPGRRELHLILRSGMIASTVVAIYGLFEFLSQSNPVYASTFSVSNSRYASFALDHFGRRIRSTVGHPVYLGSFLAMMLPLTVHATLVGRGVGRYAGAAAAGSQVVGLLLTFTRGAYASAFVGFAYYLSGRATRQVLIVVAAVGMVAGVTLHSNGVWETLAGRQTMRQLQNIRTDQRGVAYWQSTALLSESPLLGIGSGHYRYLARRHNDWNDTPDNMHLRLLAETGLAGYSAFVVICVSILSRLREAERRLSNAIDRDLTRAIAASIVGFLVDMVTCDALYFPLTRLAFWLLVGCGIGLSRADCRIRLHNTKREALV